MKMNILQYSALDLVTRIFCEFAMPLDINKYRKYVDDFDLTEEQKVEMLRTVWSIMENFVDRAFGAHPVQQCRNHLPEKDLQSPAEIVESKKITSVFGNEPAPQLGRKDESNGIKKEAGYHVKPK